MIHTISDSDEFRVSVCASERRFGSSTVLSAVTTTQSVASHVRLQKQQYRILKLFEFLLKQTRVVFFKR